MRRCSASRSQSLALPARAGRQIDDAVVKTVVAVLPKLESSGRQAISAPILRSGDVAALVEARELPDLLFQFRSTRKGLTLMAGVRSELAAPRGDVAK